MPPDSVQRNAPYPSTLRLEPTITEPSADTLEASLSKPPPGKSPKPTMPPDSVQRNASYPLLLEPLPTITEPSADVALAVLAL